jgi:hypothetical protein
MSPCRHWLSYCRIACTPEFRRLQAELSAKHSYREAARLLTMLLPCEPPNHVTMRNRTHLSPCRLNGELGKNPPPLPFELSIFGDDILNSAA